MLFEKKKTAHAVLRWSSLFLRLDSWFVAALTSLIKIFSRSKTGPPNDSPVQQLS